MKAKCDESEVRHDEKVEQISPCVIDGFFVKPLGDDMRVKICYSNILWIEAEGDYSHIHLVSGSYVSVTYGILKLEEELASHNFIRINRSEIVNVGRVCRYCGNALYIDGRAHSFTVSKGFRQSTFACFRELERK
jgi:DNA-binding LytR/AlgR family response regulator